MVPEYPALHAQPVGTFGPLLLAGHATGLHVLLKKGAVSNGMTLPEWPDMQLQPATTLEPVERAGQGTIWQVLV
jgi:hypothetical protein